MQGLPLCRVCAFDDGQQRPEELIAGGRAVATAVRLCWPLVVYSRRVFNRRMFNRRVLDT